MKFLKPPAAQGVRLVISFDTGIPRLRRPPEAAGKLLARSLVTDHTPARSRAPGSEFHPASCLSPFSPQQAWLRLRPASHLLPEQGVRFQASAGRCANLTTPTARQQKISLPSFLKILAIATVATTPFPPAGPRNRVLRRLWGLEGLQSINAGLRELMKAANLDPAQRKSRLSISLSVSAPRINAAGTHGPLPPMSSSSFPPPQPRARRQRAPPP